MRQLDSAVYSLGCCTSSEMSLYTWAKVISGERLTDVVIEGLTSDRDRIKYNAERDPGLAPCT